ncbi:hypothetical protein Tdes44962_MAKER04092 [Teratosphaeria destructans]|uniref:Uncharacterized protein n=1 Tax=Teratosphaeria destructans TaxID=418781 RepID=A0A9W7SN79_9PEZI|nr:hypothetical protein Tdes44962_MAKER04092 [Teratosphaeria destructans]
MFRNQTTSPVPLHLRQPRHHRQAHHGQQTGSYQESFPCQDSSSGSASSIQSHSAMVHEANDMLQLSMHMPSHPFSNRFEVLAVPQPVAEPRNNSQFHVPNRYRRSRNSRGTKEAKRRRDARRSRRKLAAQLLDEQLSRDIDAALTEVDMFPQVGHPTPTPSLPMAGSQHFGAPPRIPATPPQHPNFDFPVINMDFIPQLAPQSKSNTPPTTPPTFSIPSWCPNVPALTRSLWTDSLPKFFDLSALPEPNETPVRTPTSSRSSNVCQELQLWRGHDIIKPKQSRFFPAPQNPPRPNVKLPSPTGCTLHITEKILPPVTMDDLPAPPPYQESVSGSDSAMAETCFDEVVAELEAPQTHTRKVASPVLEPSAANLWRILMDQDGLLEGCAGLGTYLVNLNTQEPDDAHSSAWSSALELNQSYTKAAELDNTEVPYVHANSLTADELSLSPYIDEHANIRDPVVGFVAWPSPPVGLNELMIDQDVVGHAYLDNKYLNNLERASASEEHITVMSDVNPDTKIDYQPSMPPFLLTEILPVDCIASPVEEKDTETILAKSDAHFLSEQSLFDLPSQTAPVAPIKNGSRQSAIGLADFLKLGHAKNCWCPDCEEEIPELVPPEKLEEGEDDWMVYSPTSTVETGSETTVDSVSGEGQADQADNAGSTSPHLTCSWEDWYPSEKNDEAWATALERDSMVDATEGDARCEDWDCWT